MATLVPAAVARPAHETDEPAEGSATITRAIDIRIRGQLRLGMITSGESREVLGERR